MVVTATATGFTHGAGMGIAQRSQHLAHHISAADEMILVADGVAVLLIS